MGGSLLKRICTLYQLGLVSCILTQKSNSLCHTSHRKINVPSPMGHGFLCLYLPIDSCQLNARCSSARPRPCDAQSHALYVCKVHMLHSKVVSNSPTPVKMTPLDDVCSLVRRVRNRHLFHWASQRRHKMALPPWIKSQGNFWPEETESFL